MKELGLAIVRGRRRPTPRRRPSTAPRPASRPRTRSPPSRGYASRRAIWPLPPSRSGRRRTIIATSSRNRPWAPSRARAAPCRLADEQIDFGRPHEARVAHDVVLVQSKPAPRTRRAELADAVRSAGRDHVVVGALRCCSISHIASHVVAGEAPVAPRVEVAERAAPSRARA